MDTGCSYGAKDNVLLLHLQNIMLEKTDAIDDGVPLIGHHDEGYPQQRSRQIVTTKAQIIHPAIV